MIWTWRYNISMVQSMLNFAMFLANSNEETTRSIRCDPYCPHKVSITFHQRLMLFSISNAFKKLNRRQQKFDSYCPWYNDCFSIWVAFPSVSDDTKFDQRTIRFDPCYVLRVLSKNIFLFVSNIHKIGIKDKTAWPISPF